MKRAALLVLASVFAAGAADGGAWTLERNKFAFIAGTTASTAARRYGQDGTLGRPIVFNKLLLQSWMEYGLTNAVTIFAAPEYVLAQSNMGSPGVASIHSASVEAGLRVLLLSHVGMVSFQTSAKSGGAFDMSVSSSGEAGRQFEARLLYGRSFKLFRRDAFVDVEVAQRWIAHPRPDEFVWEGTAGCWVTKKNLVLAQSFNFMTDSTARAPYEPYRLSKLELSWVHRLSARWLLQSGYFISLAGRNIVRERGVTTAIWFQT